MRQLTPQDLVDIREHFPLDACLQPPDLAVPPEAARAFDALFDAARAQGPAAEIDYALPYPKYLFLEHLAAAHGVMLHGSNNRAIDVLRPIRQSADSSEFGNLDAIYATQDPLWALFFAVMDRTGWMGTTNGAIWLLNGSGARLRRYYFALEANHLRGRPWQQGAMYILPGAGFEPDPTMQGETGSGYRLEATHWIHRGELAPLAKINVEPQDFPFIDCIWGYDMEAFSRSMERESLAGFPFLDDPEIYPILPDR